MKIKSNSIMFDIVLIILTAGLWNIIWMQRRQIKDCNRLLGHKKYSFILWAIFTFFTAGIYHIIHEYRISKDIYLIYCEKKKISNEMVEFVALASGGSTLFFLWAGADIYQQLLLNEIAESET